MSVLAEIHRFDSKDAFLADAQRYRRELLAHCYRMTGSLHDAEDLVQETYLRAWKSYDGFEGRSSIRTWLYRIATNTCLTSLDGRKRRPLPSGLGAPTSDPTRRHRRASTRSPGCEPLPDAPDEHPSDPSVIVASRDSVRLAFIAALQHLSARQRAVLVLREVLQWKAAEVGEAIGASTAAVNSLLQRARAQLDEMQPSQDDDIAAPESPEAQDLLAQYVDGLRDLRHGQAGRAVHRGRDLRDAARSTAGIRVRRTSSRCRRCTAPPRAPATCAS